ncbi:unnamed protein product [Parajaminaea phylloscopi]
MQAPSGPHHAAAAASSAWQGGRGPAPPTATPPQASHTDVGGSVGGPNQTQSGDAKYVCPNCGKAFGRDDLLRRHLAREARALAQPQFDRQKSCYECARSKARCDLEVPSCGRCRARGKSCVYGARSGNPNVRRQRDSTGPPGNAVAIAASGGAAGQNMAGHADGPYMNHWGMQSGSNDTAYYSDSSRNSHTPGSRHSGEDDHSESGLSWSDASHSYNAGAQSYNSSSGPDNSTHPGDFSIASQESMDQSDLVTPTTFFARHALDASMHPPPPPPPPAPLHASGPGAAGLMTDIDRARVGYKTEDGEETPIGRMVSAFAAGPSSMAAQAPVHEHDPRAKGSAAAMAQAWSNGNASNAANAAAFGQAPVGQLHSGTSSMGPPMQPGAAPRLASNDNRSNHRPQPHRLLTGANMPQPPQANQSMNYLGSGKPLFSAMVDISGWLGEPVVPSPLYPTGPSLAPFAATLPTGLDPISESMQPTPVAQPLSQPTVAQSQMGQDVDMMQNLSSTSQQPQTSQPQMPASRYWWANPPSQSDFNLMQGVAQATANHLSHYPHLMVLPDPSSPVPPTVHRPWIATIRGNIPGALAIARVVLAGYAVRLPASESIVWEGIARETRRLVHAHEALCAESTPDLDVFGATQALFFYCILLMMCNDAGAVGHVDVALTNSAFFGLSQLAKTLSARVQQAQKRRQAQSAAAPAADGKPGQEWLQWGSEETMRRSVWAAYAMLVLQRYRDSADMSEGRLAGVDLILDLELPAVALEFEAGSQDEWAKARAALYPNVAPTLTFRDLLRYRPSGHGRSRAGTVSNNVNGTDTPEDHATPGSNASASAAGPPPQELLDYFERHDAFVATVLSIAFCLDTGIGA